MTRGQSREGSGGWAASGNPREHRRATRSQRLWWKRMRSGRGFPVPADRDAVRAWRATAASSPRLRGCPGHQTFPRFTAPVFTQHEYFTCPVGQPVDGSFEKSAQFSRVGLRLRILARRCRPGSTRQRSGRLRVPVDPTAPRPCARERLVHGNAGEPRGKGCAPVELPQVGVGVDIRLLHDIFRFGVIAKDRPATR